MYFVRSLQMMRYYLACHYSKQMINWNFKEKS